MTTPPVPPGVEPIQWAQTWAQACTELAAIAEEVRLIADPGALARELGDLAREADDPQLHAVVLAAREPLTIDWSKPAPTYTPHPTRSALRLAKLTTLAVPEDVLAEVVAHAASVPDGFEVGGRIVVRDGVASRYMRLENRSTKAGRFSVQTSWRPGENECSLILHSHPRSGSHMPSADDFTYSQRMNWGTFAIFHPGHGVGVYRPSPDGRSAVVVPVEVVAARRSPQPQGRFSFQLRSTSALRASGAMTAGDDPAPVETTDYITEITDALTASEGVFAESRRRRR